MQASSSSSLPSPSPKPPSSPLSTSSSSSSSFVSIKEWDNPFLALWPHRFDYLWADHPDPGERPIWKTESRHPLSDRLIEQGTYLYGVRFGSTTRYFLIDIDKGSNYHPHRDPLAWRRLIAALEPLGLVTAVICTSSYSGGLHLYFPFEEEQKTWAIALAVATLLENAGFKLAPGRLEVFPNCKNYSPSGEFTLFNGHRLPMQAGSYLLNDDIQLIWSDQQTFVQHWQAAQRRNSIDARILEQVIKLVRQRRLTITGKADKFINDLNAEIDAGWTGPGQTNRLLGRIALREYIFHHTLHGGTPLKGEALVQRIVAVATSLPGYFDWCRHQHEIEERSRDWALCVEGSHYYPYGFPKGQQNQPALEDFPPLSLTPNDRRREAARERIRLAIASLLEHQKLPIGITARHDALVACGIGSGTLYRHKDLWHPDFFGVEGISATDIPDGSEPTDMVVPVDNPPHPPASEGCGPAGYTKGAPTGPNTPNLLVETARDSLQDKAFSPLILPPTGGGANNRSGILFVMPPSKPIPLPSDPPGYSTVSPETPPVDEATLAGLAHCHQIVLDGYLQEEARQQAARDALEQQQAAKKRAEQDKLITRMRSWLASGDPILMAEARTWQQANPGLMDSA